MKMQTVCGVEFLIDAADAEFFRKHVWRLDENGEVVATIELSPGRTSTIYAALAVHPIPGGQGEVGYLNGDKLDLRSENLFQV